MKVCRNCGAIGDPVKKTNGSFMIEIVLWVCFIVPGLIYTLWRLTSKIDVCRSCGGDQLIPVETPEGRKLAPDHAEQKMQPSPIAVAAGRKLGRMFARK